jgi:two-component system secretion response regulator SsrB
VFSVAALPLALKNSTVPLTLAIVDDHPIVRAGLRAAVEPQEDLRLLGEAGDARGAYSLVESLNPEVLLLDVDLPGADGLTAAREISRRWPSVRLLMISARVDEHLVTEAFNAGAAGYVGKEQPVEDILQALRSVGHGHKYFPPRISAETVASRQRRGGEGPLGMLSTREREVFDLLVRGYTNEAVAQQLSISRRTVETHRSRILKKLHVHSAVELIRLAARHDLLDG